MVWFAETETSSLQFQRPSFADPPAWLSHLHLAGVPLGHQPLWETPSEAPSLRLCLPSDLTASGLRANESSCRGHEMLLLGFLRNIRVAGQEFCPPDQHTGINRMIKGLWVSTGFVGQSPARQQFRGERSGELEQVWHREHQPCTMLQEPRKKEHVTSSNQTSGPIIHPCLSSTKMH